MAAKPKTKAAPRISLRLSEELRRRLEDLAIQGLYGSTRTEVAENLVREQIVSLVKSDFFARARRTQALSGRRQRRKGG